MGPSLETQMVDDETEPASEELPPHLREEPPEGVGACTLALKNIPCSHSSNSGSCSSYQDSVLFRVMFLLTSWRGSRIYSSKTLSRIGFDHLHGSGFSEAFEKKHQLVQLLSQKDVGMLSLFKYCACKGAQAFS
ncbi:uncharacterized protein LOC132074730 isoform X1 [Ammospiza nelsoni]|uniref:uncharacterized protein LOC132074730 isoform X1 n=1 Tax=Ammospiza nelsoni TaxID=2857394 RepID=UPI00286CA965|nr:uncharacterized protein LOC132074730 isoform X1 [Ammospiza nelsoni]